MKHAITKKFITDTPKHTHISTRKTFAKAPFLGPLTAYYIPEAGQLNMSFVHEAMPPMSEAPVMVHSKTKELIYLICGKVTVLLNGKSISLKKNDCLVIPAGTTHQFKTKKEGMEAVSVLVPPIDPANPDATIVCNLKTDKI